MKTKNANKLTTYDYAKAIEALYERLNNNMDEYWIRGTIVRLQIAMRESIND